MTKELSSMGELDFAKFLDAIKEGGLERRDVAATSHTSAVSVKDWEVVQQAVGQPVDEQAES
jgi:hypothetical protein